MQADLTDRIVTARAAGERRASSLWRLHVVASPDAKWRGAVLRFGKSGPFGDGTLIGRAPEAGRALRLDDSTLSRRHALVQRGPGESLRLTDLGSSNGSFVDGKRIDAADLQHGSIIRLGGNVLVLELDHGQRPETDEPTADIPGRSEVARILRGALADAAHDSLPVMLQGETGTGKEHAAHELHVRSGRPGPLVRLNVAAITESLFEAELFGHVAGAYTGASSPRPGRIREAHRGTLVLDELGELPPSHQAKLLRVLEEKSVRAVGGTRDEPVDVRFCGSTNADLHARVRDGRFRRDLLARFHAHLVHVPPLAQRRPDLLDLADAVLPLTEAHGGSRSWRSVLHEEAVEALLCHDWPDNLRELHGVLVKLRRQVGNGLVPRSALPPQVLGERELKRTVEDTVRVAEGHASLPAPDAAELRRALREEHGVVEQVARRYGRHRKQVYRWLEQAGVTEDELRALRDA